MLHALEVSLILLVSAFMSIGRSEQVKYNVHNSSLLGAQQSSETFLIKGNTPCHIGNYSQTCLKGSPKGRAKFGCLRQVTP